MEGGREVTFCQLPWEALHQKKTLDNIRIEVKTDQHTDTDGIHVPGTRSECEVTSLWRHAIRQDSRV